MSQFFVFPHRQRVGLGRSALAALTDLLAADKNIRQISVEDPAPGFQRLRDFVSVDRALHLGLLSPACFYPEDEVPPDQRVAWNSSPVHPANWPRYSRAFKKILLETPQQRRRLKLLLSLSRLLPSKISSERRLEDAQVDSRRPRRRELSVTTAETTGPEQNGLIFWEKATSELTPLRLREKRRLRLESLEWYSQQRSLGDVQHELELEWQELFKSICGSIRVIRANHPLL